MAYGIISIIAYVIFLIWVDATGNKGNNSVEYVAVGNGPAIINLAAAMGEAFAIQTYIIPILRKSPDEKKYPLYLFLTFSIGGSIYAYIAFAGSLGISSIIKEFYIDFTKKFREKTVPF